MAINNDEMSIQLEKLINIVFVVGASRSGKTSLGQLISSVRNCEFIDEPLLLSTIYIKSQMGSVSEEEASSIFKMYLDELIFDTVLMRRSNFRPLDQSSVWKTTDVSEIFSRIGLKRKIDAAKYIVNNGFTVVVSLPDNVDNIARIKDLYRDSKIVRVIRNGLSVAKLVDEKGWFSNENLLRPFDAMVTSKFETNGKTYQLPWWVQKEERSLFLELNGLERGLYYWCQINRNFNQCTTSLAIKFEDLINSYYPTKEKLFIFSGGNMSENFGVIENQILSYENEQTIDDGFLHRSLLGARYFEIMRNCYG